MSATYEHSRIIRQPVITEKSYAGTGKANQYTFRVARYASKLQVKRAIEALFEVKVEKLQMISVPGKVRRRGAHIGRRPGYRKAVVRLAEGHTLNVAEEA